MIASVYFGAFLQKELFFYACTIFSPGCEVERALIAANDPCVHHEVSCIYQAPTFSDYRNTKEKKQAFFSFMYPLVSEVNDIVLKQREKAKAILRLPIDTLGAKQRAWLVMTAKAYALKFESLEDIYHQQGELLSRIDVIPPSLALAQSAKESGWGGSRFAVQANNLFGQWCFKRGCGIVPAGRNEKARHEIKRFRSVNRSVASYIRNINKHPSYAVFRAARKKLRESSGYFNGHDLAHGLSKYSQLGQQYVDELVSLMRMNQLSRYDQRFWQEFSEGAYTKKISSLPY